MLNTPKNQMHLMLDMMHYDPVAHETHGQNVVVYDFHPHMDTDLVNLGALLNLSFSDVGFDADLNIPAFLNAFSKDVNGLTDSHGEVTHIRPNDSEVLTDEYIDAMYLVAQKLELPIVSINLSYDFLFTRLAEFGFAELAESKEVAPLLATLQERYYALYHVLTTFLKWYALGRQSIDFDMFEELCESYFPSHNQAKSA